MNHKFIKGTVKLNNLYLTELPDLSDVVIDGVFFCQINRLTSLKGSPKIIKGDFWCDYNELKSLEGGPEIIDGWFNCADNKITSLKWFPKYIGRQLTISNNPMRFTEEEIRNVCDVRGAIHV